MDELENLAKAMEQSAAELRKLELLPEKTYEDLLLLAHEITHILNMNSDRKKQQSNLPLRSDLKLENQTFESEWGIYDDTPPNEHSENWHAHEDMTGDR